MSSRRKLSAITGLKVLATLGIFVWHCGFLKSPDLGARCVEIFLVASGFLTAYNHHGLYTGTFDESIAIVRKKLRAIYPHLSCWVLARHRLYVRCAQCGRLHAFWPGGYSYCASDAYAGVDSGRFVRLRWGGVVPLGRAVLLCDYSRGI